MITIICPLYNSQDTIQRLIRSIFSQEVMPSEIIFSDDGSTDATLKLLNENLAAQEVKDISIKIITGPNEGAGAARNRAIKESTCQWISFLDSDDVWDPKKIRLVLEKICSNGLCNFIYHPEYYYRSGRPSSIIHASDSLDLSDNIPKQLYKRNIFSTSAVTCSRKLLEKAGYFDETLPNGQDYDLWLKLSPYMHPCKINEILGAYFERGESISSRPYSKRIWAELKIAMRYRNYVSTLVFLGKIVKISFSKQWIFTILNLITRKSSHTL